MAQTSLSTPMDKLNEQYSTAMNKFTSGVESQIWDNGSREERIDFMKSVFEARIAGVRLHAKTGQPMDVPGFGIDEDHNVVFGLEKSELPSAGKSLDSSMLPVHFPEDGKPLTPVRASRYDMALQTFGDIGGTESEQSQEFGK